MALIECKKCGNQVSDKAKVCPKCGAKIKASKTKEVTIKDEEKLKKNNWAKTSIVVALCLIVFTSNQTGYGWYGVYGWLTSLVISSWLIWRGIAAFRYLSKGKSKLTLLRLRNKGLTILMCILGISGVVSGVIDMYQLEEYEKWRKASLLSSYSFRTGSPYSSKWSYFEWHYKDSLYANNVKRIDWKSVENKIVISAHLRAFDTSTDLVMSIVHRNGVGDAILLDITDAHTNRYLNEFDIVTLKSFEDKIPIKICIDRNYPLVLECPYTFASRSADGTAWFSLLIYGEDYEMMLDELKKGKSCFITIDNVDKTYKFDIEGLEWGEVIGNDVVAESEQEVAKIDSTKMSKFSEGAQEIVEAGSDSTTVCVSAGDNYERKTISDLKRMGLNGPVCFMSIETLFSEKDGSKRYYQQYEFDKNGMLTETMNERVGFPVDMTAEGKQSGCTYVDGKLISSIVEDENASLSSYKYEYVDYDKERTDVYRINEQNEKELAMTLFFHENGYLRQKTVYWDNSGDFESYDEFGVMIDETNSVIKKTDSYGNWKEKEVMEEGECIYKIIRGISYY